MTAVRSPLAAEIGAFPTSDLQEHLTRARQNSPGARLTGAKKKEAVQGYIDEAMTAVEEDLRKRCANKETITISMS